MTGFLIVKTTLKHLLYQVSTRLAVETKIVNLQRFYASGLVSIKEGLLSSSKRSCCERGHARTAMIVSRCNTTCSVFTTILFHLLVRCESLLEKMVQEINCQC